MAKGVVSVFSDMGESWSAIGDVKMDGSHVGSVRMPFARSKTTSMTTLYKLGPAAAPKGSLVRM